MNSSIPTAKSDLQHFKNKLTDNGRKYLKFLYAEKIAPITIRVVNDAVCSGMAGGVVLELPNTSVITLEQLEQFKDTVKFRIVGGYDESRLNNLHNLKVLEDGEPFFASDWVSYYRTGNIYSKDELRGILKAFEKMEQGLDKNLSDLEKAKLLYDRIVQNINYYDNDNSDQIRTLRSVLLGYGVCAGMALTFKELCDRNGIDCDYVEGVSGINGHAWNVIRCNGKKYTIDPTFDCKIRSLPEKVVDSKSFGKSLKGVAKPMDFEREQHYTRNISELSDTQRQQLDDKIYGRGTVLRQKWTKIDSANGRNIAYCKIGAFKMFGKTFYKYAVNDEGYIREYFSDQAFDELKYDMFSLYSADKNLFFKVLSSTLFSEKNLSDTINHGSGYLGRLCIREKLPIKICDQLSSLYTKFSGMLFDHGKSIDISNGVALHFQKPKIFTTLLKEQPQMEFLRPGGKVVTLVQTGRKTVGEKSLYQFDYLCDVDGVLNSTTLLSDSDLCSAQTFDATNRDSESVKKQVASGMLAPSTLKSHRQYANYVGGLHNGKVYFDTDIANALKDEMSV